MSIESAKAFLERLKSDGDFSKTVGKIATVQQRIEYVNKAGFDFTKEELEIANEELSKKILRNVVDYRYEPAPKYQLFDVKEYEDTLRRIKSGELVKG